MTEERLTIAIPAEGLVRILHRSEKDVLLALLFSGGGTVRTLVADHLDKHTYFPFLL